MQNYQIYQYIACSDSLDITSNGRGRAAMARIMKNAHQDNRQQVYI